MRLALDRCKALRFYRKICSKGSQKVERIAKLLGNGNRNIGKKEVKENPPAPIGGNEKI